MHIVYRRCADVVPSVDDTRFGSAVMQVVVLSQLAELYY